MDIWVHKRLHQHMKIEMDWNLHLEMPFNNQLDVDLLSRISTNFDDLDDLKVENNSESFLSSFPCYENFKYKTGLGFVLHNGSGLVDESSIYVTSKLDWAKNLRKTKPRNLNAAIKELKTVKESIKKNSSMDVPMSEETKKLFDFFLNEPEPTFKGTYNWLYSGGCITNFENQDGLFLCCVDKSFDQNVIKVLRLNENCTKVESEENLALTNNQNVYQIITKKFNEDQIFGVRQKNVFELLTTAKGCGNSLHRFYKTTESDRRLTSCDFSPTKDEVVLVSSDTRLRSTRIHDLETKSCIYQIVSQVYLHRDSWSKVLFREQDLALADRSYLWIFDPRLAGMVPALKYSPYSVNEMDCEVVANILKCELDPNYLYLGLTHSLLQLDVRCLKSTKTVQKWTHMLHQYPMHGNIVVDQNRELIFLQGDKPDQLVGITNECFQDVDERYFLSKSMPCLLKSMKRSLRVAHYNELGFYPAVASRFDSTVTGSCAIKDKRNKMHYFVTNIMGDVYGCKIKEADDDSTDDLNNMLDSIRKYEEHVKELNIGQVYKPPLVKDMNHIFSKVEAAGPKPDPKIGFQDPHYIWPLGDFFTAEQVKSYKDYLANKVLTVWGFNEPEEDEDVDEEEEEKEKGAEFEKPKTTKDDDDIEGEDDGEISATEKVAEWLNRLN